MPGESSLFFALLRSQEEQKSAPVTERALKWFESKYGKTAEPIHCSRYYTVKESWTFTPSWIIYLPTDELPERFMSENNDKFEYIHLLCQKAQGSDDYHYLRVPAAFFTENATLQQMRQSHNPLNGSTELILILSEKEFKLDNYDDVDFVQFLVR